MPNFLSFWTSLELCAVCTWSQAWRKCKNETLAIQPACLSLPFLPPVGSEKGRTCDSMEWGKAALRGQRLESCVAGQFSLGKSSSVIWHLPGDPSERKAQHGIHSNWDWGPMPSLSWDFPMLWEVAIKRNAKRWRTCQQCQRRNEIWEKAETWVWCDRIHAEIL